MFTNKFSVVLKSLVTFWSKKFEKRKEKTYKIHQFDQNYFIGFCVIEKKIKKVEKVSFWKLNLLYFCKFLYISETKKLKKGKNIN